MPKLLTQVLTPLFDETFEEVFIHFLRHSMIPRCTVNFLLLILALISNSHASNSNQLKIGITSPLNKVFQSEPFNFQGKFIHQAEIELALNEYESTQIVLFPETDFNGIKINVSSLTHENKIDAINANII